VSLCRPAGAAWRRAAALPIAAALWLAGARCVDVTVPSVVFEFTPPFTDTVANVGDMTPALPCWLKADGRPVPCRLGIAVVSAGQVAAVTDDRLTIESFGTATVELRPLNVQLSTDTIVRRAVVRAVVPRLVITRQGPADTLLFVGEEVVLAAQPYTLRGRPLTGVQVRWTQVSGADVATLVSGADARARALGPGVAVFRASCDTATVERRVIVIIRS